MDGLYLSFGIGIYLLELWKMANLNRVCFKCKTAPHMRVNSRTKYLTEREFYDSRTEQSIEQHLRMGTWRSEERSCMTMETCTGGKLKGTKSMDLASCWWKTVTSTLVISRMARSQARESITRREKWWLKVFGKAASFRAKIYIVFLMP